MTHPMYRVSSLGRPIDPRFRSNLLALLGSAAAGLVVGVLSLYSATPLTTSPVMAGVGVFLAWAIARELDPDHAASAVLAMPLAFAALLIAPAELMLGVAVLLAARTISGTVGAPLHNVDRLALVGLAGLLGAGGITIVALPGLLLAAAIGTPNRRYVGLTATGMVAAAAVSAALARADLVWEAVTGADWVMLLMVVASAFALSKPGLVASQADLGGSLSARRVTVARWAAVATVVLAFLVGGGIGIAASFPTVGAASVATGVVGIVRRRRGSSLIKEPTRL